MTMRKICIINIILIFIFTALAFTQEEVKNNRPQDKEIQADKTFTLQKLPSSLEEMLGLALKSNPDILVAEADLHHAQTMVNQVRLKVSQILVDAFQQRRVQEETLDITKTSYEQMKEKVDAGLMGPGPLQTKRNDLATAEAELAGMDSAIRRYAGLDPISGKTPESLEKALSIAFQSNGEVALARADLVRAEAKSNQIRLKVTEEVSITFQIQRSKRNALAIADKVLQQVQERVEKGVLHENEKLAAFQAFIEAEAELAQVDARLRYLLGLGGIFQSSK